MVEEDCLNLMLSCSVRSSRLKCTAETNRINNGRVDVFNLDTLRVTIPCDLWPFLHFSPNGWCSLAGGRSSCLEYSMLYLFGTDRLKEIG